MRTLGAIVVTLLARGACNDKDATRAATGAGSLGSAAAIGSGSAADPAVAAAAKPRTNPCPLGDGEIVVDLDEPGGVFHVRFLTDGMAPKEVHTFEYNPAHGASAALYAKESGCVARVSGRGGSQEPPTWRAVLIEWKDAAAKQTKYDDGDEVSDEDRTTWAQGTLIDTCMAH